MDAKKVKRKWDRNWAQSKTAEADLSQAQPQLALRLANVVMKIKYWDENS